VSASPSCFALVSDERSGVATSEIALYTAAVALEMIQGSSKCTQHSLDAGRFGGLRLKPIQLRSLAFYIASKLSYPIFGIEQIVATK